MVEHSRHPQRLESNMEQRPHPQNTMIRIEPAAENYEMVVFAQAAVAAD